MSEDTRYVTSVGCTWHGSIYEVGVTKSVPGLRVNGVPVDTGGIPCCPHCGSMLTEYPTRAHFDRGAKEFMQDELGGDTEYLAWLQSLHDIGTCRPLKDWHWRAAFEAWKERQ